MKQKKVLLGAHMSIAGDLSKALLEGASIGCTTIQIFTKSNRQWGAKQFTKEEIALFKKTQKETGIDPVICHASYLINLASASTDTYHKSVAALKEEVDRCAQLDIPYLVLHPGSAVSNSQEKAEEQIIQGLNQVLKKETTVTILLETMAGQGTSIGSTFEQLAHIRHGVTHKHAVGFCADTCHLFAAGYDLSTPTHYHALWELFDKQLGLSHLKAIHLNNSKKELGSKVDRHEDIKTGKIPMKAFELLMNDERFFDVPKILETPKESLTDDERNIKALLETMSPLTRKTFLMKI